MEYWFIPVAPQIFSVKGFEMSSVYSEKLEYKSVRIQKPHKPPIIPI